MKLTDSIHLLRIDFNIILGPDQKIPRFVNVILIFGDKITLIDTGVKGSEQEIFEYIRSQGRDVNEIETIILSHSHPDHIGSAAKIKELTRCKVIAHPLEKEWVEDLEAQNRQRPVPGFYNLVDTPVKIDEFVENDQRLKLQDDITLKFIKSAGHSKGSLNILFMEDGILFTADSIPLKNDIPNYDNYRALMQSLEKIRTNDRYTVLLTSWTPPLTDQEEIKKMISEGETYMKRIDSVVKECYEVRLEDPLGNCKCAVDKLGLPGFLVNPVVDRAFKSHLNY